MNVIYECDNNHPKSQPAPQAPAPQQQQAAPSAPAGSGQTKAQIQQALTNLDIRLANGEISETRSMLKAV